MMKRLVILFILLTVVLVCGCTTPANVAKEVPNVLKNVSAEISTMETPNITLETVLQPLRTSVDYVQPARIVPTPISLKLPGEPVIGEWTYTGDPVYQCHATFTPDSKAFASCSSGDVRYATKSFIWTQVPSSFNWMRNYTLTDILDNSNYTVLYSEHTGELTSDIMPGNGYFIKVG